MAVDALIRLAVLPICTRVLTSQHGNGVNLLAAGLIVVDKEARVTLGAGPSQKVVVAQLIRLLALLDALHGRDADGDGLVQPAVAGIPVGLLGGNLLVLRLGGSTGGGLGGNGERNLGRGAAVAARGVGV